jgi:hypothetical protein
LLDSAPRVPLSKTMTSMRRCFDAGMNDHPAKPFDGGDTHSCNAWPQRLVAADRPGAA